MTKMKDKIIPILLIVSVMIITAIISTKVTIASSGNSVKIGNITIDSDLKLAQTAKNNSLTFLYSDLWNYMGPNYRLAVNGQSIYLNTGTCMYHEESSSNAQGGYYIMSIIDIEGDDVTVYNYNRSNPRHPTDAVTKKGAAALGYVIAKISSYTSRVYNPPSSHVSEWKDKDVITKLYHTYLRDDTPSGFWEGNNNNNVDYINATLKDKAIAYANRFRRDVAEPEKVDENTLKPKAIKKGNYTYIGPFKQKEGGYDAQNIVISVDDGANSMRSTSYFIKTANDEFVSKSVLNGMPGANQEFYVRYTGTIRKNWDVKINYARELYKARLVLLRNEHENGQQLGIFWGYDTTGFNKTLEWKGKVDAKFKIKKVDRYGNPVEKAEFIVYYKSGSTKKYITGYDFTEECVTEFSTSKANAVKFVTNSNGNVNVKGVPLDGEDSKDFYVEEVYTPFGGKNGDPNDVSYQPSSERTKKITVHSDDENYSVNFVKITNIEIGDLELDKKGNNGVALNNVMFKVKDVNTGKYLKIKNVNDAISSYTIEKYEDIEYTTKENATLFKSDDSGKISIKNIPSGQYKWVEFKNAEEGKENDWNNYKYGYKKEAENNSSQTGHVYDVTVQKKQNNVTTLQNTPEFGNIKLEKRDSLAPDVALESVQFKIQIQPDSQTGLVNYLQLRDPNGNICIGENNTVSVATINEKNQYGNGYYSVKYVSDESQATIFITDGSGNFYINGLEVWYNRNTKYKYTIKEYNIGNKVFKYYDTDGNLKDSHELNTNETTLFQIKNKQVRVDLTGYVWEDICDYSKITIKNDHWDDGEKKIEGIPVTLYKNNVKYAETKTDSDGSYFFPAIIRYNPDGTIQKSIDLYAVGSNEPGSGLLQYTIEFEYNGLKYQSVIRDTGTSENGSKADEESGYRDRINNNFNTIQGKEIKSGNSTTGQTSTGIRLSYDSDEQYKSKLIEYMGYNTEPKDGKIVVGNSDEEYRKFIQMMALIANSTVRQHWSYGVWTVKSLNLGIYEREQTDLAIITDVDNIKMTINGYTHTYNYKRRSTNPINYETQDNYRGKTSGYDTYLDGFSVIAKNKTTGNAYNLSYTREVYPSYVGYTDKNQNQDSKLRMYITYKYVINNQSSFLVNKVNKLKVYCDKNYENPQANGVNGITINALNDTNDCRIYEVSLNNIEINPDENLVFRITYEIGTPAILKLKEGDYETARAVTEIASYTTYKDNSLYASIDKDSAPDNIDYNTINTYEDDTDAAPGLTIKKTDDKTLTVNMFEDIKTPESANINETLGDGIYENSESLVKGAKVTLVNKNTGESAKLYTIGNGGIVNEIDANVEALGDSGEHTFVGLIPGEYYIKYEYGETNSRNTIIINNPDKKVTTESYKSTIINNKNTVVRNLINTYYIQKNGQWDDNIDNTNDIVYWYQADETEQYSVAIDNYIKRKEINEHLKNITYKSKTDYEGLIDDEKYHLMDARTPLMCVAIEDKQNESTDALSDDNGKKKHNYKSRFGIIERPIQDFEIVKEISKIKIVLANGQILVEGDPRTENMNYVTYPDGGVLKVEVDNEIIQGAKLEITYVMNATNKSNANYDNIEYYMFGNNRSNLVCSTIKLIDYLDKELVYIEDGNWKVLSSSNDATSLGVSKETVNKGGSYTFIEYTGDNLVELKPKTLENEADTKDLGTIQASKLLSSSEDMVFDNIVEIYDLDNPTGRFYDGTPGNYDFEHSECDNNVHPKRAILTIVPPTGAENVIIYILIGIGCLVVLSGGIILIKKKVL